MTRLGYLNLRLVTHGIQRTSNVWARLEMRSYGKESVKIQVMEAELHTWVRGIAANPILLFGYP
jgi:hypothetical protein